MKKFISTIATAAVLASVSFAADYTIKFSHVVNANTPKGRAADFFAKRVDELTGGKVEVIVFPSAQLYGDKGEMKALKIGNIQMVAPSFSKFTSLIPQLQLFDLPFLFRDVEHVHAVMDGAVGDKLKSMVDDKGFKAITYWDNGFKQLSSNSKALIAPSDAAGQKFRIMSSKVIQAQFVALGANPQVLPFSEVYSALQQGVVDAAENPLSNFYTKKFYEVQTDLTLSEHGYLGYLVVVNKQFWDKLPADLKTKVNQAMTEATALNRKLAAELDLDYMAKIKEYADSTGKLKIHKLSADQKAAWKSITSKIYPDFYSVIGQDLIEEAQK